MTCQKCQSKKAAAYDEAMKPAFAAFKAQACRSVAREIKSGARRYALSPSSLDTLCPGLSLVSPRGLVSRLNILIWDEVATTRRRFGFGGYMPLLCLRSAMLYARWATFVEHSHKSRAA